MWQYENSVETDIFIDKFENEATTLEGKFLEQTSQNK